MNDYDDEMEAAQGGSKHDLTLGDICTVQGGRDAGKTVLVIKAGIQTKFGLKAITVEYSSQRQAGNKVWVEPSNLVFNGAQDLDVANAVKEADYQEWKAKKQSGVPEMGSQKPWQKFGGRKNYPEKKEAAQESSAADDFPPF
jgi:hypothetical protein